MKNLSCKIKAVITMFSITFAVQSFAQQGQVEINQDQNITRLLNVKKQLNKTENSSDRYKIQIYNGNRPGAYEAQKEFRESFADWRSTDIYEPPNFKIWVGNFRTRLEADRALKRIKRKFPSAFIFKPKKEKNG
ncbi:SPOR domain-containing protein [Seonamhaeicola sp. ML3]|uniref:SPOR domain-containing protein n=1 Tax=Seonamhaeicola sp. ML3 TaxID=2937786 RepID=UPI00200E681D|nr:SPOR domain-containing protein [Seonamhaeicola sp. ML3]